MELVFCLLSCCSLVDSCLLLYFPAFVKKLGTGKFILHPKAAVDPSKADQIIKLV